MLFLPVLAFGSCPISSDWQANRKTEKGAQQSVKWCEVLLQLQALDRMAQQPLQQLPTATLPLKGRYVVEKRQQ